MAIDVLNHMWVGVFAASYARQYHDDMARGNGPATRRGCERFAEEAAAIADDALQAYRDTCHLAPESGDVTSASA